MIGAIGLIILLFIANQGLYSGYLKRHKFFSKNLMNALYLYHLLFFVVYYIYAQYNPSDSLSYFERPQSELLNWMDFFGTSTQFISFISWPFINIFNFNYEMVMVLFSWFGFLGFLYAYLFFRDNIPLKIEVFKVVNLLPLILFLPNMHFWTSSLGKGAPIFMGLMMFAYAITNPKERWFTLILSAIIVYFIRPHVFLFVAVGTVLGYMTGREKISFSKKLLIYVAMIGGLMLVQDQILGIAGLESSENYIEDFSSFSESRAGKLSRSDSGVDMANYPLPLKLFTFWFRPLFFDAPGLLGLIVSVENLIYLLLFTKILNKNFIKFLKKSPISVKLSITVFLLSSLAMTFVMSNLGIIMRQKSMVMYFMFFVIYYYLAQLKYDRVMRIRKIKKLREQRELEQKTLLAGQ